MSEDLWLLTETLRWNMVDSIISFKNLEEKYKNVKKCTKYIMIIPEIVVDVAFILLTCLVGKKKADAVISAMGYDGGKIK